MVGYMFSRRMYLAVTYDSGTYTKRGRAFDERRRNFR